MSPAGVRATPAATAAASTRLTCSSVEDTLPLDERVGADRVVACRKRRDLDFRSELGERLGDPALALVHVDDDLYRLRPRSAHRARLSRLPENEGDLRARHPQRVALAACPDRGSGFAVSEPPLRVDSR